ncbi:MAG: DNA-methyltransferase [Limisphaerales bacterium]
MNCRAAVSVPVSVGLLWQAVGVLANLGLVPAHDDGSIQLYRASLTTREQSLFARAERTIARGLKSFLEVGLALKEIRDKRLYRQQHDTFEEYCARRWELSRPRAYELCAASEVVTDLSAVADIRLLPKNERQTRALTRLKTTEHRQRAWEMAVEMAAAEKRPVTAQDTEEAVRHLSKSASTESIHAHRGRVTLGLRSMLDKIHTGNCIDLLPRLPDGSVDALITDPPFGKRKGVWDVMTKELAEMVVRQALRVLKPTGSFFWFGNNEATADLWPVFKALRPRWLTWFYRNSSNISYATFGWNSQVIVYGHRGDPVFNLDEGRVPYSENTCTTRVNHDESTSHYGIKKNGKSEKTYHPQGRKPMDVIECPAVTAGTERAEGRWHPVQKPLGLMRMLVAVSTNPGDLVLDPFCGSGTTCLAAKQLERHFIGFERDAEFACKARQRLAGA